MFVVVQVRQTLQQAGTAGPYSAALLVIGAALTLSCRSIGTKCREAARVAFYSPRPIVIPSVTAATPTARLPKLYARAMP